jgi:hypothetical protein
MKKFKKALGIGIMVTLFMGIFVWMVQDSSLEIALKAWGIVLGVSIVIIVGVVLATSD